MIFTLVLILLNTGILYGVKYFLINQAVTQVEDSYASTEKSILGAGKEKVNLKDMEHLAEANANRDLNIEVADEMGNVVNSSHNFPSVQLRNKESLGQIIILEAKDSHFAIKTDALVKDGKVVGYLQVVKNLGKEYQFIDLLFVLISIAVFLGIILSAGAGYIVSRNLLKPIDRITKIAKEISITDLNKRIEISGPDDELARLSVTFNEMIERLESSFEKQSQFVSDASHELRTPISVIQGYINLIDRWGKNNEKVLQESIDAIKMEAANMGELTERLLFIARSERGVVKIEKASFKLKELVDEIVKETMLIAPDHQISYEVPKGLMMLADRKMIKQMFRALLDNSIKFTQPGGEIKILATKAKSGSKVEISITDTGAGIPKDELDSIFDRFYRVDKASTKETGGSGLGLSIVKWIIDVHEGEISIDSSLGQGTTVLIFL